MKITEYPQITTLESTNVMLADGPNGTRKIAGSDLPFAVMGLAGIPAHRTLFRGKNLGTELTQIQKSNIQNGTFTDLWLGDYWVIGSVNWRIADFNYWYGRGDTAFTSNHLIIVPDTNLTTAKMNDTSDTTGGYVGSQMYTTNLTSVKTTVNNAFGDAVLTHREYLISTVTSGYPSAGAYADSTVELMNEPMVFGSYIYTPANTGSTDVKRYTISNAQLALFQMAPTYIVTSGGYWLRDVVSTGHFARVDGYGGATSSGAANQFGVRPVFAIG